MTEEHPFWTEAGWVRAGELEQGDAVFTLAGGWLRVSGATWLQTRETVYNLEVEGTHSYFVGSLAAWVHNACGDGGAGAGGASAGPSIRGRLREAGRDGLPGAPTVRSVQISSPQVRSDIQISSPRRIQPPARTFLEGP